MDDKKTSQKKDDVNVVQTGQISEATVNSIESKLQKKQCDQCTETDQQKESVQKEKQKKPEQAHPANFQIGFGHGLIFAHSLAWPPTFGDDVKHYTVDAITEYWNTHTPSFEIHKTFGQVVCEALMDRQTVQTFAHSTVVKELNKQLDHNLMFYCHTFSHCPIDFITLFFHFQGMAIIFDNDFNSVPIVKYQQICEMLSHLQNAERTYSIWILEQKIGGDITKVAEIADIKNLKFIMSRLKLANMVPLMHALFASPTVTGKITALVRLIELYDVMWSDIAWASIEKFAEFMFMCIDWLMEKTRLAGDFAASGFEWCKAKTEGFFEKCKSKKEDKNHGVSVEKQCKPKYITCRLCANLAAYGCSLCKHHLCEEHVKAGSEICICKLKTFRHTPTACQCDTDNDCLFRAICMQHKFSVPRLKCELFKGLNNQWFIKRYHNLREGFADILPEFPEFAEHIKRQLHCHEMCDEYMMIWIVCVKPWSIVCFRPSETEGEQVDETYGLLRPRGKFTSIRLDPAVRHFEPFPLEKELTVPDFFLWGAPYDKECYFETLETNTTLKRQDDLKAKKNCEILATVEIPQTISADKVSELRLPPIGASAEDMEKVQSTLESLKTPNKKEFKEESTSLSSSESTSSDITSTSVLSDLQKEVEKYSKLGDAASRRPNSSGSESATEESAPEVEADSDDKRSFWDLLKNFEFNQVGLRVSEWFKTCSKDVLLWFEGNPLFTGLISLLVGVASFFGITITTFSGDVGAIGILKRLTDATRSMYYAERGVSSIVSAFSSTMDAAKDMLGISKNAESDRFKQEVSEAYDLAKDMLAIAANKPGEFLNNGNKFQEFKKNMEIIRKVYQDLAKVSSSPQLAQIAPIWHALNRTYEKLFLTYNKMMACATTRQEPVVVYLYGDTGIGKSSLTTHLINALNLKMNRQMQTFTVSKGPEFWNGYAQQDIVRIDDMNAVIGQDGDTDSVVLFNLATNAPYNPNMASIEEKNIMATPKIIFACSNHPTVPSNSIIQSRHPWERRRDYFLHVTWPGHEKCPKNTKNCPCWEGISEDNYDHLRLTLCDPCVSSKVEISGDDGFDKYDLKGTRDKRYEKENNKSFKPHYDGFKYEVKTDQEMIEAGEVISVDTLVLMIAGKEAERYDQFERRIKNSIMAGTLQKQAMSWETNPTVMILGPPGTGKSHMLQRYVEKVRTKIKKINTLAEFDAFADQGFKNAEPCTVIFNDLSACITSQNFEKFVLMIQSRYDENTSPVDFWICAANEDVLSTKLMELNNSEEYLRLFYRRCEVFRTTFKPKRWKDKKFFELCKKNFYVETDIKIKEKIDDFVNYFHNDEKITQETAINRLCIIKPVIKEIIFCNSLQEATELPVTCVFSMDMNSSEFIDMVNNMSLPKIISLIRSGSVKTMSKTMSTEDLVKKIHSIIQKARSMQGTTFDSTESFILEVWNKKYFEEFSNECMVLKLKDKMYYINALSRPPSCGIFKTTTDVIKEFAEDAKTSCETIEISHFMKTSTLLPHWLILAGECITTIMGVAATGVSAVFSVKDQQQMFDSQSFVTQLEETMRSGTHTVQESVLNNLSRSITKSVPLFPGKNHIKKPQHSDISLDPIYEASPEEYDKNNKSYRPRREAEDYDKNQKSSHRPKREAAPEDYDKTQKSYRPRRQTDKQSRPLLNFIEPNEIEDAAAEYAYETPMVASRTGPKLETIRFEVDLSHVRKNTLGKQIKKEFSKKENQDLNKEACTDPSLYAITEKMLKNCVEICAANGQRLCSGLLIRGRCVRTVAHLLDTMDIHQIRVRTLDGRTWPVEILEREECLDRLDLRIVSEHFPLAADITNHFPKLENTIAEGSKAVLVTPDLSILSDSVTVYFRPYIVNNLTWRNFANYTVGMYAIEYKGHRVGYDYTGIQTKYGDCGSFLVLLDNTWQDGKVIGMHFAASDYKGYASPLRQEQYKDKIRFQTVPQLPPSTELFEPVQSEDPCFIAKCKLKNHVPSKTKLFKNWYPIGPKLYEPSILSSLDTRGNGKSLLREEALRWCTKREGLSAEVRRDLKVAMKEFAYNYVSIFKRRGVKLRKLTSTEALNKLKGSTCSEPLNTATSAGFPFNKFTERPGKTAYITVGENGERRFNKDPRNAKCLAFLMEEINRLEHEPQGRYSDVIFQCFLKDELRKLKKIYDEPRTRTIAAAPLHFMIVYRKYFYAAHVAMMENWDVIGPKVGISPTSMQWHTMFTNMLKISTHGIDLDFSGWDFSHDPFIVSLLPLFYTILYEELDNTVTSEDQAVRYSLYAKVANFKLLIGNDLYRTTGGIPSGYPGTSPDNSIINEFLHYYVYKKVMSKASPAHANITSFYEDVKVCTYGDDCFSAISFWASKFYNGLVLKDEFGRLGFNATAADKENEIVAIKPLKDCTFLSRRFEFRHGFWLGPLQYPNLCKPTHYSHDRRSHYFWETPDEEIQAVDIVQNVYESLLYNAAIESEDCFREFYEVAEKVMIETNGPALPSYADAMSRMYGIDSVKDVIEGVTFFHMPEVLKMDWSHCIPENFAKMSNRVTYSYGPEYSYPGAPKSNKMPKNLKRLLLYVNEKLNKQYNSILVNRYPIGGEIPWHKDNEPEVDLSHGVFGLTLKGDGYIEFRDPTTRDGFYLDPGVGYLMNEDNLARYHHRRNSHYQETISFTFRLLAPRQ